VGRPRNRWLLLQSEDYGKVNNVLSDGGRLGWRMGRGAGWGHNDRAIVSSRPFPGPLLPLKRLFVRQFLLPATPTGIITASVVSSAERSRRKWNSRSSRQRTRLASAPTGSASKNRSSPRIAAPRGRPFSSLRPLFRDSDYALRSSARLVMSSYWRAGPTKAFTSPITRFSISSALSGGAV
jgi:hypothetical protein